MLIRLRARNYRVLVDVDLTLRPLTVQTCSNDQTNSVKFTIPLHQRSLYWWECACLHQPTGGYMLDV
jgi:hypothetical protein